jgi:hypothetical protein
MEVHRILCDDEGFALPGEKESGDAERPCGTVGDDQVPGEQEMSRERARKRARDSRRAGVPSGAPYPQALEGVRSQTRGTTWPRLPGNLPEKGNAGAEIHEVDLGTGLGGGIGGRRVVPGKAVAGARRDEGSRAPARRDVTLGGELFVYLEDHVAGHAELAGQLPGRGKPLLRFKRPSRTAWRSWR